MARSSQISLSELDPDQQPRRASPVRTLPELDPTQLRIPELDPKQLGRAIAAEGKTGFSDGSTVADSRKISVSLEDLGEMFEPGLDCCIYKVPRDLRKINEEAYTPQVISIGPLHNKSYTEYLSDVEKQKLRYIKKFCERRSGKEKFKKFSKIIKENERLIRSFYAENINGIPSFTFVSIILCDAVFIIELFLRNKEQVDVRGFDSLLDIPIRRAATKLDLQLLENQLPYCVLKELFRSMDDISNPSRDHHDRDPFLILALQFFYDTDQLPLLLRSIANLQHFTDLKRYTLLKEFNPPDDVNNKHIRDLPCATKLRESGVKFMKSIHQDRRSSLKVNCEYIARPVLQCIPCITLQELELRIPRFEVSNETECLIRNVMAFEQLHYPYNTHVCNYILLMHSLIETEKDVDLLAKKGIIVNCLGDNAAVANMINKLALQVTPSYSFYYGVGEKLKAHYGNRWNHAKATLKSVYYRDPWIGTGTVVATLLLLLILIQTVCTILQVL